MYTPAEAASIDLAGAPPISTDLPPPPPPATAATDQQNSSAAAAPLQRQNVVLRVEVATKGQAHLLTYIVWALDILFVLAAVLLCATNYQSYDTLGEVRRLYQAQLAFGSLCLGTVLATLALLVGSVRASLREQRVWSARQRYFTSTAAALLAIQLAGSSVYVAAVALELAQEDCSYPWSALAVLEFVRKLVQSTYMCLVLACLTDMTLWRNKQALDMHPDRMLLLDRPLRDRVRRLAPLLAIWAGLAAAAAVSLAGRVDNTEQSDLEALHGCNLQLSQSTCSASKYQVAAVSMGLGALVCILCLYFWTSWRALKDHRQLPLVRYRATAIFTRVQVRLIGPVIVAVVLFTMLLEFIPVVVRRSCNGAVFVVTGNLPVDLALTVAAVVLALLYMPKAQELDSPLLQEFLQEFSWTQAAMPADLERRNQQLAASEAATSQLAGKKKSVASQVAGYLPRQLRWVVGRLAHVQGLAAAEVQLAHEPLFCVELAVLLLYWARLAYREEPQLDNTYLHIQDAMQAFGLEHWEMISDPDTDTHCVLAWSASQAVVAFRGTASIQNVLTDVKVWRVAHQPGRRWHGRRVQCHAGFYSAWLSGGFNRRVLSRLRELDGATAGPLRFWVTGHSLGGALAVLACSDIRREHPDSQITCYTFGCPRVFNKAGAREFNEGVPDTWGIINGTDPVTWHPKTGFKQVGQRVNIDGDGNLLLRPTYFELSVVRRGAIVEHHLCASYALSFAAVFKAQFAPTKSLPGGAKGVEALAAAVDLCRYMCLTNADLAALQDPEVQAADVDLESESRTTSAMPLQRSKVTRGGCCGGERQYSEHQGKREGGGVSGGDGGSGAAPTRGKPP